MKKIDLVVTRHGALVEYLREIGLCDETVEVKAHATQMDVLDKRVAGVLPHNLSCLCDTYTEVPLSLPQELRGVELTLEQVRQYAGTARTYKVLVAEHSRGFCGFCSSPDIKEETWWGQDSVTVYTVIRCMECGRMEVL